MHGLLRNFNLEYVCISTSFGESESKNENYFYEMLAYCVYGKWQYAHIWSTILTRK